MDIDTNPFLAAIMRAVRARRPALREDQPYFTRVERVPAGNYVEIWFRTGGCTWDHVGGCTMCNYGFGGPTSAEEIVSSVRAALDELDDEPNELMISPSGGMWDGREVPAQALAPVYRLARNLGPQRFFVETRAETICTERMSEIRRELPDTALAVELGLESCDDAVLAYCVNKGSGAQTFVRAARALRANDIAVYANVSLGTALLDRVTAVHDAVSSVRWALANGADRVVLFPLHVKPFTLLDVLQRGGRYQPVSLWDLADALIALGPRLSPMVEIAWYKSYYDTTEKVTTSPVGCARCTADLVAQLDEYRRTQDFAVIAALDADRCPCAPPRASGVALPLNDAELAESVIDQYLALAEQLGLQEQWQRFGPRLHTALRRGFQGYTARLSQDFADVV
jgi:archaeosine synthase beta-subunit